MKHMSSAALKTAAAVTPALTKAETFRIAASGYDHMKTRVFDGMCLLEHLDLIRFRAFDIIGTPLEPAATALAERGVNVGTSFGSLMDATSWTQEDIHELSCKCRGETAAGDTIASRFMRLAEAS